LLTPIKKGNSKRGKKRSKAAGGFGRGAGPVIASVADQEGNYSKNWGGKKKTLPKKGI